MMHITILLYEMYEYIKCIISDFIHNKKHDAGVDIEYYFKSGLFTYPNINACEWFVAHHSIQLHNPLNLEAF